jgi:hypothetical protein
MRPLWDYPPGVRAPGEGVAPGEPGSVAMADAINANLQAEAMFAAPVEALDRSNLRTFLASGHTEYGTERAQAAKGGAFAIQSGFQRPPGLWRLELRSRSRGSALALPLDALC